MEAGRLESVLWGGGGRVEDKVRQGNWAGGDEAESGGRRVGLGLPGWGWGDGKDGTHGPHVVGGTAGVSLRWGEGEQLWGKGREPRGGGCDGSGG